MKKYILIVMEYFDRFVVLLILNFIVISGKDVDMFLTVEMFQVSRSYNDPKSCCRNTSQ